MWKALTIAAVAIALTYLVFGENAVHEQQVQPVAIAKLNDNPSTYYGHQISITGKVLAGTGIFGSGAYWLRGSSNAELMVLTSRGVPPAGTDVTVRGKLRQAMVIGARQYQVLIADDRYAAAR